EAHHGDAVRALDRAGLNRLPVNGVERGAQESRERSLAYASVRSGDEEVMPHAQPTVAVLHSPARHAPTDSRSRRNSTSGVGTVSENLRRALPASTVGGRTARTANPSRCANSAAARAWLFSPTIRGTICERLPRVSHPS